MSSLRNGAAMILAAIGVFCFGALLARDFRAHILLPTSLGAIGMATVDLWSSQGPVSCLLEGLALAAVLQTGYLFGLFALHAAAEPDKAALETVWR